jgi:hypothetical protein
MGIGRFFKKLKHGAGNFFKKVGHGLSDTFKKDGYLSKGLNAVGNVVGTLDKIPILGDVLRPITSVARTATNLLGNGLSIGNGLVNSVKDKNVSGIKQSLGDIANIPKDANSLVKGSQTAVADTKANLTNALEKAKPAPPADSGGGIKFA